MMNRTLQDTIKQAADTNDFRSIFDRLANDVELQVTVDIAPSAHRVRRGRQSVMDQLQSRDGVAAISSPLEFFAEGSRFVACSDETFAIGSGVSMRSERTVVVDVRNGTITRIGIHYDVTPAVEGHESINAVGLDAAAALAR
jgi:hypothetical protein